MKNHPVSVRELRRVIHTAQRAGIEARAQVLMRRAKALLELLEHPLNVSADANVTNGLELKYEGAVALEALAEGDSMVGAIIAISIGSLCGLCCLIGCVVGGGKMLKNKDEKEGTKKRGSLCGALCSADEIVENNADAPEHPSSSSNKLLSKSGPNSLYYGIR